VFYQVDCKIQIKTYCFLSLSKGFSGAISSYPLQSSIFLKKKIKGFSLLWTGAFIFIKLFLIISIFLLITEFIGYGYIVNPVVLRLAFHETSRWFICCSTYQYNFASLFDWYPFIITVNFTTKIFGQKIFTIRFGINASIFACCVCW
jgi:hypothetical protein